MTVLFLRGYLSRPRARFLPVAVAVGAAVEGAVVKAEERLGRVGERVRGRAVKEGSLQWQRTGFWPIVRLPLELPLV